MSLTKNNSLKSNKSNVPLYRSAFNSDFRNDISYGTKNRYELYRSTSKPDQSEDEKQINEDYKQSAKLNNICNTKDSVEESQDFEKSSIKKHDGYVGFANLPNQIYWKAVKKGFEFTLMVVGASGLGKSTLINSMFLTNIYDPTTYPGPTERIKKTMSVETTKVKLKDSGVNLTLTVVDTPGFGDLIDNSNSWIPIINYIERKYEEFFTSESKVNRKPFEDQRVHCCLYFIRPTGHGLSNLDVEFMKRLSDKVNIIPIIAKADTLTAEECYEFKQQILKDIENNGISIYKFPDIIDEDEVHEMNETFRRLVPFAVVGSNTIIEEDGEIFRGRKYPWGAVNISNLQHCDFAALQKMMISSHMYDLKETTNNTFYENYRSGRLASFVNEGKCVTSPFLQIEEDKQNLELKLQQMKINMEDLLMQKVRQKEKELKDTERLLNMRMEVSGKALEEEAKEYEKRRKVFEFERQRWEKENLQVESSSVGGSKLSLEEKADRRRKSVFESLMFTK